MKFVYSQGDEFCDSTFNGSEEVAIENGYKKVTEQMYDKLLKRKAHWVNGELVEREKTSEEIAEDEKAAKLSKIEEYRKLLSDTDYQAIKYAEGWITEEEYAEIKNNRQAWRNKINELET